MLYFAWYFSSSQRLLNSEVKRSIVMKSMLSSPLGIDQLLSAVL